jgi:uncharacterized protein YlxW (UPF0749 family)
MSTPDDPHMSDGPTPIRDDAHATPSQARRSRARLLEALRRPSRGQLAGAVLVGLLGFAMVTQVKSNQEDDTFAGLRSADLVQLLNGLNAEARRADKEIADLERTRSELSDSTQRRQAALKRATEESNTLGILAGTLPAQGPGIRIEVTDPKDKVTLNNLLDGVEELRAAGAEAIEFNDEVRVVAQTSFEDAERGVVVDGRRISAPYVIDVIGNPDTLATTLDFIGGFSFDVKASDGDVKVTRLDDVKITTVTKPSSPDFASSADGQ